ncbi:MAG TPA: hypothetical protein VNM67_20150 [Thermoanaerobaculia bacterium]|jgi:hypothetical protein|nr:hypothetical protein [Thermoanaerobaculia bacterium]
MTEQREVRIDGKEDSWDFDGTRRHHIRLGLRLTPTERLRWLEDTVDEMRRLQGLARKGRKMDGQTARS